MKQIDLLFSKCIIFNKIASTIPRKHILIWFERALLRANKEQSKTLLSFKDSILNDELDDNEIISLFKEWSDVLNNQPIREEKDLSFEERFDKSYLKNKKLFDLVAISDIRKDFPELNKVSFNKELISLIKDKKYALQTFDGRHGKLTEEEIEGSISIDNRIFVYVAKRD